MCSTVDSKVTINDQILIRINKEAANKESSDEDVAEPTPEGIHQDATEISTVTVIARRNVGSGGESRIWSLNQPIGNYDSPMFGVLGDGNDPTEPPAPEGFSWDNCLFNKPLDQPWETILFNDRKVKHEARAFLPEDETKPSSRDVIVNFVRKPLANGMDKRLKDGKEASIV